MNDIWYYMLYIIYAHKTVNVTCSLQVSCYNKHPGHKIVALVYGYREENDSVDIHSAMDWQATDIILTT